MSEAGDRSDEEPVDPSAQLCRGKAPEGAMPDVAQCRTVPERSGHDLTALKCYFIDL